MTRTQTNVRQYGRAEEDGVMHWCGRADKVRIEGGLWDSRTSLLPDKELLITLYQHALRPITDCMYTGWIIHIMSSIDAWIDSGDVSTWMYALTV